MSEQGPAEVRRLGEISTVNPTLTLLGAYSRDWVLPLFAEHLEPVEGSVSAEWFHERVTEALQEAREDKEWQGDRSPSARCAWWVKQRWLDTEMSDSGVRYRLSPYSLRALRFVREIAEGESTVSGARLGSIAYAVRRLADMTSPDRFAQAQRIDEEIAELQRRKEEVLAGRGGTATAAQLSEQLREVLTMTRSLPADFRQLRSMVEDRHKVIARRPWLRPRRPTWSSRTSTRMTSSRALRRVSPTGGSPGCCPRRKSPRRSSGTWTRSWPRLSRGTHITPASAAVTGNDVLDADECRAGCAGGLRALDSFLAARAH